MLKERFQRRIKLIAIAAFVLAGCAYFAARSEIDRIDFLTFIFLGPGLGGVLISVVCGRISTRLGPCKPEGVGVLLFMMAVMGIAFLNQTLAGASGRWAVRMLEARLGFEASPWQAHAVSAVHTAFVVTLIYGATAPWFAKKAIASDADFSGPDRLGAFLVTLPKLAPVAALIAAMNVLFVSGDQMKAAMDALSTNYWAQLFMKMSVFAVLFALLGGLALVLSKAIADAYLRLDPAPEAIAADRAPAT